MGFLYRDHRKLHYQLLVNREHPKSAPLVVYLHGLMMDNLSSGLFTFAQAVRTEAHVLLFDLIGHGLSSAEKRGYRITDHISDLKALILHVQEELMLERNSPKPLPIIIIGCSFGGTLALQAAAKIETVSSVVLLEGHIGSERFLTQLTSDLESDGEEAELLILRHFQHWWHRGSERKRQKLEKRAQFLIHESSLLQDLKKERHQDHIDRRLPILYLYGEDSDALRAAESHYQDRHTGQTSLDLFIKFPNKTHALLWEATDEVNLELVKWIQKISKHYNNDEWPRDQKLGEGLEQ